MLRQRLIERQRTESPAVTVRGREVTRIEAFSDAVFGFAITLLVVSQQVPHSYDELLGTIRGFGAFACCFLVLFTFWKTQYDFFREYGLNDGFTIWVNGLLMFLVIFFIYPLKFLFTWVVVRFSGAPNGVRLPGGRDVPAIEGSQMPGLMAIYGVGMAAVMLVFLLLHWHAYRRRAEIGLTAREAHRAMTRVWVFAIGGLMAMVSVAVAQVGGPSYCFLAGMIYCALSPCIAVVLAVRRRMWSRRQVLGAVDGAV